MLTGGEDGITDKDVAGRIGHRFQRLDRSDAGSHHRREGTGETGNGDFLHQGPDAQGKVKLGVIPLPADALLG